MCFWFVIGRPREDNQFSGVKNMQRFKKNDTFLLLTVMGIFTIMHDLVYYRRYFTAGISLYS